MRAKVSLPRRLSGSRRFLPGHRVVRFAFRRTGLSEALLPKPPSADPVTCTAEAQYQPTPGAGRAKTHSNRSYYKIHLFGPYFASNLASPAELPVLFSALIMYLLQTVCPPYAVLHSIQTARQRRGDRGTDRVVAGTQAPTNPQPHRGFGYRLEPAT